MKGELESHAGFRDRRPMSSGATATRAACSAYMVVTAMVGVVPSPAHSAPQSHPPLRLCCFLLFPNSFSRFLRALSRLSSSRTLAR